MKYKVLDLFAGAGGLSLGFEKTDLFSVSVAIENNPCAKETYRTNFPDTTILNDIREFSDFSQFINNYGSFDVIIGGPPCQGFSNANRQHNQIINLNNLLVKKYIEFVLGILPKVFVLENVKMLNSNTHFFLLSNDDFLFQNVSNQRLHKERIKIGGGLVLSEVLQFHSGNCIQFPDTPILEIKKLLSLRCKKKEKGKDINSQIKQLIDGNKTLLQLLEPSKEEISSMYIMTKEFEEKVRSFSILSELSNQNIFVETIYENENELTIICYSLIVKKYIEARLKDTYQLKDDIYNTAEFGVPQKRERFVMIGVRKDLCKSLVAIKPINTIPKYNTVHDAIYDLEQVIPSTKIDKKGIKRVVKNTGSLKTLCDSTYIWNHFITDSSPVALQRFSLIKQGQNFHALDKKYISSYANPEKTQNSIYKRLEYSEPSPTVTNVRKCMWIHPTQNRAISIREAARLQSFPDSFIFCGSKDRQYQQVGNAVPPLFAKAIAKAVIKILKS